MPKSAVKRKRAAARSPRRTSAGRKTLKDSEIITLKVPLSSWNKLRKSLFVTEDQDKYNSDANDNNDYGDFNPGGPTHSDSDGDSSDSASGDGDVNS